MNDFICPYRVDRKSKGALSYLDRERYEFKDVFSECVGAGCPCFEAVPYDAEGGTRFNCICTRNGGQLALGDAGVVLKKEGTE